MNDDIKRKFSDYIKERFEPGDNVVIIFHYGSQLESIEGDSYDDDIWELYLDDRLVSVGDTLEEILSK